MKNTKCANCGEELERKDYRRYGILLTISGIAMFPLLLIIAYGTIIPFLAPVIAIGLGIPFLLRKERYFFFCQHCKLKFSQDEGKTKGSHLHS